MASPEYLKISAWNETHTALCGITLDQSETQQKRIYSPKEDTKENVFKHLSKQTTLKAWTFILKSKKSHLAENQTC